MGIVLLDFVGMIPRYRTRVYRHPFSLPERQDAPYSCTARVHPMAPIRWRGSIYRYTRSNAAEKFARKSPTFQ